MDWNETLDSASFQVNCIPGLNEAAVKGSEGLTQVSQRIDQTLINRPSHFLGTTKSMAIGPLALFAATPPS
jgi:hypothetical protein